MINLLIGIVGALVGGGVTYLGQRLEYARTSRRKATRELIVQWHSPDMVRSRIVGYATLTENLESGAPKSYMQLFRDLRQLGRIDEYIDVSRVMHFFELAGVQYAANELDKRLLGACLGDQLNYWRETLLAPTHAISVSLDPNAENSWFTPVDQMARDLKL